VAERPLSGGFANRAKRLPKDLSAPPWARWRTKTRAARAIRFMETYCRLPKGHGAGGPVRLAPFQREWLEEVLADGVNSALMSVARGNGKSTLLAGLATWALFDQDPDGGAPQVPIVATRVMQAYRSVYGVALAMIESSAELADRCLIFTASNAMKVRVRNGGEMFPVSNDHAGLQGLDPSLAVCDEIGFMPMESWDALVLASGKRPRSLVVGIGTPGYDQDNALWAIRDGVLEAGAPPGLVYTEIAAPAGCDHRDEAMWALANPALAAGYLNPEPLRTAAARKGGEAAFRIFHLGQWVEGVESWLGDDGRAVWGALCDPWLPLGGAKTWVGVDMAIRHDTAAVVAVQRRPDGRLHAWARIWVPAPDTGIDVTDVMRHLRELDRLYDLQAVAFDPRFFDLPAKTLEDEGLPMVEIPQSVERMSPACGSTLEVIQRSGLSHDGDERFSRQILNAMARYNERGFTLSKGKSRGKIDAAVALVLAVDRALREPPAEEAFVV
jgi:phage terminase large subunit-like protein